MARVRAKDTTPELAVRSAVYALGYRYRLHRRDLSGTPDLVFPGKRKVIFVHGCFWHRHTKCRKARFPKTRQKYWKAKFEANIARDSRNLQALQADGWEVLILWECELFDENQLKTTLKTFLES